VLDKSQNKNSKLIKRVKTMEDELRDEYDLKSLKSENPILSSIPSKK
jgi:hypothetical protein